MNIQLTMALMDRNPAELAHIIKTQKVEHAGTIGNMLQFIEREGDEFHQLVQMILKKDFEYLTRKTEGQLSLLDKLLKSWLMAEEIKPSHLIVIKDVAPLLDVFNRQFFKRFDNNMQDVSLSAFQLMLLESELHPFLFTQYADRPEVVIAQIDKCDLKINREQIKSQYLSYVEKSKLVDHIQNARDSETFKI